MVREGLFREDLYYRINTITIRIPPLRERREDILPLAEHFLAQLSASIGKPMTGISRRSAGSTLQLCLAGQCARASQHHREGSRAVHLGRRSAGLPSSRDEAADSEPRPAAGDNKLEQVERDLLFEALRRHKGNISAAARELGITRDTIRYRIRKHGLNAG